MTLRRIKGHYRLVIAFLPHSLPPTTHLLHEVSVHAAAPTSINLNLWQQLLWSLLSLYLLVDDVADTGLLWGALLTGIRHEVVLMVIVVRVARHHIMRAVIVRILMNKWLMRMVDQASIGFDAIDATWTIFWRACQIDVGIHRLVDCERSLTAAAFSLLLSISLCNIVEYVFLILQLLFSTINYLEALNLPCQVARLTLALVLLLTPSVCMLVLIEHAWLVWVIESGQRRCRVYTIRFYLERMPERRGILLSLVRKLTLIVAAYLVLLVPDVVLLFQVIE